MTSLKKDHSFKNSHSLNGLHEFSHNIGHIKRNISLSLAFSEYFFIQVVLNQKKRVVLLHGNRPVHNSETNF